MADRDGQSVSQSVSQDQTAQNQSIAKAGGIVDHFFPLFNVLSERISIPFLLCWICELWSLFHQIMIAFWFRNGGLSGKEGRLYNTIYTLHAYQHINTPNYISLGVIGGITALTVGVLLFQLWYWETRRDFVAWALYPTRFLVEFIPNMILVPTAVAFGSELPGVLGVESTR
jgi:hypothetical protein